MERATAPFFWRARTGLPALPAERGPPRFGARNGSGDFLVLGSRSEVSARRETAESSNVMNRRMGEDTRYMLFGSSR
jgi:hypothetical protein